MRFKYALALLCLMVSGVTLAASCEENFTKKGNAFSGTQYSASVSMANLSVASAIGQMRGIALKNNMDVLSEDAESGSMLIEERATSTRRAIPLIISASDDAGIGRVEALVKTSPGVLAKADTIKAYICKMLVEIKAGNEGKNAAAIGKASSASGAPTVISAHTLSYQLADEAKANNAVINPRYKGRVFTISGKVAHQSQDGNTQKVSFDIPANGTSDFASLTGEAYFKAGIVCKMAKNQTAYALSLREHEKIKLTGIFSHFDDVLDVFWLKECRPE